MTDNRIKICYIGGGSLNWAWTLMDDLAEERDLTGQVCLYDIDLAAAQANAEIGNALMDEYNPGSWRFTVADRLSLALEGSDFIFISIVPGVLEDMELDVHAPEVYGIFQSVGDTVGPGGLIRSLRVTPHYEEIAKAIKDYAPDAWVFNYTNPMSLCTKVLYEVFPKIKAFGCCHEVFGTQKLLRKAIEWAGLAKASEIPREEIKTNVLGINHFTWIDKASWKSVDLFPLYREFVQTHWQHGFQEGGDDNWLNSFFESCERVKFDLFKQFGLIAAAGDRHLAEFCPREWYLKNPELVKEWKFGLTPVSFRIEKREKLKQKSLDYRNGTDKFVPRSSGEEGIKQLKALLGLGDIVTNVNLPNHGQMPDLPLDSVVETNAYFSKDSVQPVLAKGLPNPIRNLTLRHLLNQDGILEAALDRDLGKAFLIFQNDPQVSGLSRVNSEKLFRTMVSSLSPEYQF